MSPTPTPTAGLATRAILVACALAAALSLTTSPAAAQTIAGYEFADWTAVDANVATGTVRGSSIALAGTLVRSAPSSTLDGSSPIFDNAAFTPPLPASDALEFGGFQPAYAYTLTFGAPQTDPVLHLQSLGSALQFPGGTLIDKLSGDAALVVSAGTVTATSMQPDANGTVRLNGTFASISFTAAPVDAAIQPDGIGLQVGVKLPPAPPPPPPLPPPPPPSGPENVRAPAIRDAGGGTYTCDPGDWSNVASPPGYSFVWRTQDASRTFATTQTWAPTASAYGYPIVCAVSVTGPSGPVTATSAAAVFSSAGVDRLPAPYGDVRIRGIDVFQVTQPNAGSFFSGYKPDGPFFGLCGGGTPTSWRGDTGVCALSGRSAQSAVYEGVALDEFKPTTAFVYVDVAGARPTDASLSYDLELSATTSPPVDSGARSLGSPVVVRVGNPPRSDAPWVELWERDNVVVRADDTNRNAIPIELPYAWRTAGESIRLQATLKFPDATQRGTAGYGIVQCANAGCSSNDTFSLRNVPFVDYPAIKIASIALRTFNQLNFRRGGQTLPEARAVLDRALALYPGGAGHYVSPFQTTININPALRLNATANMSTPAADDFLCNAINYTKTTAADATRSCRWDWIAAQMRAWAGGNPARGPGRVYDVLFGVHNYSNGSGTEPGTAHRNITNVSRTEPSSAAATPVFTADGYIRPLTAAAHELGHILTAPHAADCGGDGEPWPENGTDLDQMGRLQSTKFRAAAFGGFPANRLTAAQPSALNRLVPYNGTTLHDLMSYCGNSTDTATSDGEHWLSARNWNRTGRELLELGVRLGPTFRRASPRSARAAATASRGFAVGIATPGSGRIQRVVPPDERDAVPAPLAGSPYHLRSLDATGRVLLDAGVDVSGSEDIPGDGGTFIGPVDGAATTVQLLYADTLLHSMARTRPPAVRLSTPRVSGRVLEVRWRASDPDGGELEASIDFSADNGRTWRTVQAAPDSGTASIPLATLTGSRLARVRVNVNDGFAETTVRSTSIRVPGTKPRVRIIGPERRATVRTGERVTLIASAVDDAGGTLTGRSLTWFAGSKRLGSGARLRTLLPRGARNVRLVARDRNGLAGVALVPLRVTVPPLRLVSVRVPGRVNRGARTMRVRIQTSAAATLVAGGRRYALGRAARTVIVTLPRRPSAGILDVPFRIAPRGSGARGTVTGRFSTARV
jgi:hypothetical protein